MPPRAISRAAWTPAERIGALLVLGAVGTFVLSAAVIVLWLTGVLR
jgi:hypothetical protein